MAAISDTDKVSKHIAQLDAAIVETVEFLRETILNSDVEIREHIKWNSPSFYYDGAMKPFDPKEYKRDIVVMNLHRGNILLVFPTGAKINDGSGLLEGNYTDGRKIAKIANLEDAKSKADALQSAIQDWISKVEK